MNEDMGEHRSKDDVFTVDTDDSPHAINDDIQTDVPPPEPRPLQFEYFSDDYEVSTSSSRDDTSGMTTYSIFSMLWRIQVQAFIRDREIPTNRRNDEEGAAIPAILDLPRTRYFISQQEQDPMDEQHNKLEDFPVKACSICFYSRANVLPAWLRQSPRSVKRILVFCTLVLLGAVFLMMAAIVQDLQHAPSGNPPATSESTWLDNIPIPSPTLEPTRDQTFAGTADVLVTPQPSFRSESPSIVPVGWPNELLVTASPTPEKAVRGMTIYPTMAPSKQPTMAPSTRPTTARDLPALPWDRDRGMMNTPFMRMVNNNGRMGPRVRKR